MVLVSQPEEQNKIESDAFLPTAAGNFRIRICVDSAGKEHALLYVGLEIEGIKPLVRIHSECLTGDAFGSLKCDCGPQLKTAMERIQEEGAGVIVFLRQEGRGIGLANKIRAYRLQDQGLDTLDANLALGLPADDRTYEFAADMLRQLGVEKIRLMTNNPEKIAGLQMNNIEVDERVPHISGVCDSNKNYLTTKAERMGHIL
jgi:GTP cyclohydrolase II